MDLKRVVVTGLGAVTPLGNSVTEFWSNAVSGKNGVGQITRFDPSLFKTRFACEVKNFEPEKYLDKNEIRKTDLFTQFALYSASEAIDDSGLGPDILESFDSGVIWGTGQGGMTTMEDEIKGYVANEFNPRFNPFFVPKMIANMASGMISMKYGMMGINFTTVSACASSNNSLMDAFNYIRMGKARVFLSGGSEAPIMDSSLGGFNAMRALSTRNDDPMSASRPFDIDRDGFVMGEGAGALVLEEYEHSKKRGAKIYAEIAGASMTADAYHISAPHPVGKGATKCMLSAIEEAGTSPENIGYLNGHATSTPVGDLSEIRAILNVFSAIPKNLSISATKSMTGHLLGGAGAVEAILCIKALQEGIIPPNINTEKLEPEIPHSLHIVLKDAIDKKMDYAMSNAFGFGGHNSTLVFKKI